MGVVIWLASYPKSGNTWTRALLAGHDEGEALDLFVSSGIEDGLAYGPYVLSTEPATAERIDALLCLPTSREAPPGG